MIGAISATGLWWWRAQERAPSAMEAAAGPRPFVQLAGSGVGASDQLLREKSEYFDPTPLFFPTEWNYGQAPLRASLRQGPGQVFGSYAPKLTDSEQMLKPYTATPSASLENLADVLRAGNQTPFGGLGRVDIQIGRPRLAEREAYLEVRSVGQHEAIIKQALAGLAIGRSDFGPMEYLATVGPGGLIGDLVQVSGSGVEEADAFFRDYLANTYRLGARLVPGRYQVWVGP